MRHKIGVFLLSTYIMTFKGSRHFNLIKRASEYDKQANMVNQEERVGIDLLPILLIL